MPENRLPKDQRTPSLATHLIQAPQSIVLSATPVTTVICWMFLCADMQRVPKTTGALGSIEGQVSRMAISQGLG